MSKKVKKPKRLVPKPKRHYNFIIMILLLIAVPAFIATREKQNQSEKVEYENKIITTTTNFNNPNNVKTNNPLYQQCLSKEYLDEDKITEEVAKEIDELNTYLKEYDISVKYIDKETNFNYTYGANKVYYAASTIKLLMATYIYENVIDGKIDPNDEMEFNINYSYTPRKGLENTKYGTKVSIKDLVLYSVKYSDNAAYEMLLDYIGGKQVLQEYGANLRAKYTLTKDDYGNISLTDALAYLYKLDEVLNEESDYSEELKDAFINSDQNYFKIDNIKVAAKYGEAGVAFNEIGIVYDTHPYYLVVLSNIGKEKSESVFKEISERINSIHNKFYNDRISYCTSNYNK